jgi:hypothetical protein
VSIKEKAGPKVKKTTNFSLVLRAPAWSAKAYEDEAWFDENGNPSLSRKADAMKP